MLIIFLLCSALFMSLPPNVTSHRSLARPTRLFLVFCTSRVKLTVVSIVRFSISPYQLHQIVSGHGRRRIRVLLHRVSRRLSEGAFGGVDPSCFSGIVNCRWSGNAVAETTIRGRRLTPQQKQSE